jgi:hypothetical protein
MQSSNNLKNLKSFRIIVIITKNARNIPLITTKEFHY